MDKLKKVMPLFAIFVGLLVVYGLMNVFGLLDESGNLTIGKHDSTPTESFEVSEPVIAEPDETEIDWTIVETVEQEDVILTVDNCEDLANLLTLKDPFDSSVSEFAKNYKGRAIEFDAYIAYLTNHGDYKTRYDILIYAGDYSEDSSCGPNFQFEDVGVLDLGQSGLYLPDFICAGRNVHIVAEVVEYDSNTGIFELDPISVEDR